MPANEKVYTGITRAELEALKSNLRSAGFNPPSGDDVTIRGMGVVLDARYRESEKTLTITIRETPPFVSYGFIFGKIDAEIRKVDR